MFETCRIQEDLNKNIILKSAFCWLTLHNCITMYGTENTKLSCYFIYSTLISHIFLDFSHTCLSVDSVPYFSLPSRFAGNHRPFKSLTASKFTHTRCASSELTSPPRCTTSYTPCHHFVSWPSKHQSRAHTIHTSSLWFHALSIVTRT